MDPPRKRDSPGFDRLMDDIEGLNPLPDTVERSYAAGGRILKRAREKAGLKEQEVRPLYAAAYQRLYPNRKEKSSVSASALGNWEDGANPPQHGLRSILALFAVYIQATSAAQSISPSDVEDALFHFGYRRLHVEEIKALFPHGVPTRTAANPHLSDVGSMRRLLDAAWADRHYDMVLEYRIMRSAAWILADADRTVLPAEAVDELESEARRVAESGADPAQFMEYLKGLVRVSKNPNTADLVTLLRMFNDRLSGEQEKGRGSRSRPAEGRRTFGR